MAAHLALFLTAEVISVQSVDSRGGSLHGENTVHENHLHSGKIGWSTLNAPDTRPTLVCMKSPLAACSGSNTRKMTAASSLPPSRNGR